MSVPVLSPSVMLDKGQLLRLVASGIFLWGLVALLLRSLAPLGWLDQAVLPWVYIATLPGTWPALLFVVRVARLQPGQVVPGVALVTLTALFIDGFVFGWVPQVYAAPAWQLACSSIVLWGAGCGLLLAFLHEFWAVRRRP